MSVALPAYVFAASSASAEALRSGPHIVGVAALSLFATLAVLPMTLVCQQYAFSLGYGSSVAVMGLALMRSFGVPALPSSAGGSSSPAAHLSRATLWYGIRLASYLLLREITVPGKRDSSRSHDTVPLLKRIPLAMSLSIFYAFLVTPVLYALRGEGADPPKDFGGALDALWWAGVATAYAGLVLEAVADQHKFLVKRRHNATYNGKDFVGPTGGAYALCRHPNYFGHVLFWTGLFLGGAASFGTQVTAWACSALGMYGIFSVMRGSSRRLDARQQDAYGGQANFDKWKAQVKGSLAPAFLGA